ncbi:MAG: type II toxin-antitoxin system prevent-host-death family antitoxin [Mycobacterium sp.]|jgi:prevent-host-death family protein|nr:type II toxin-antitoxin system prevent-host-death family antitoxin [Mycobacterium sp.]
MKVIGVRELRQNASKYLERVEAGEELSVTMRGRLVARLVPVTATDRTRDELIANGALSPARRRGGLAGIDTTGLPEGDLSAVLAELREERF